MEGERLVEEGWGFFVIITSLFGVGGLFVIYAGMIGVCVWWGWGEVSAASVVEWGCVGPSSDVFFAARCPALTSRVPSGGQ